MPGLVEKVKTLGELLQKLSEPYRQMYCGDAQVLSRLKGVLAAIEDAELIEFAKRMKRVKNLDSFLRQVNDASQGC